MTVAFKNTIFWYWIWILIHANHFYNLELIEFKAYIAPTWISIPLSNLGWFFQKESITYNLGQNCWDKIEKPFSREKTPLPLNQSSLQSFRQIKYQRKFSTQEKTFSSLHASTISLLWHTWYCLQILLNTFNNICFFFFCAIHDAA